MPKTSSPKAKPIQQKMILKAVEAAASRRVTGEIFDRELAKLNAEQRKAVETIEGPVMVIAGPGTGKTQVLAMRVAQILKKTQAKPRNILCLTFSTSGATAMRDRLRLLIGADAYGVTVSTIHGYCNDLIASHPHVFEEWASLEQISDVERYRALNAIIDEFMPDLQLVNKKDPHARTSEILSAISKLKREGKSDPEELRNIVREYEKVMQGKSKEGTKVHEKNLLAARKFKEFVEVFVKYQEMLRETGRYDYDDMILNVIAALKQNDDLLAAQQERYLYFLVDEFQDTNGSQYAVIDLLTKPRTPEDKPNLFVVGDDDQAIYRFQGANLTNILSFHERFPTAPTIALTTSYRSTQKILNAAMSLIERNEERLVGKIPGLEKNLKACSGEEGIEPVLLHCPSDKAEPWIIADLIEERIAAGVDPEEIAIFTQKNSELHPLYEVLRARKIPVQMTGKVDLLQHPLVCQAIVILDAIHTLQDSAIAGALSCATFGCHPADLGRIFQLKRDAPSPSPSPDGRGEDAKLRKSSPSLYRLLQDFGVPGKEDPVPLHNQKALLHARDTLLDLHQKLPSRTIVETMEHVLRDSNILRRVEIDQDQVSNESVISSSPNNPHPPAPSPSGRRGVMDPLDVAALQEFFDRVKYRAYEQASFSFEVFMNDLACHRNPDYSDLRMTYDVPHLTEKGVQLLTAHRSKGLEFHTVILTNFRDRHWDKKHSPHGIALPEDLLFGWEKDQKAFEKSQDERRVAYVAMTRAKKELIMTCPKELTAGDKLKSVSPSAFFAEAGKLPEEHAEMKDPEKAATLLMKPPREIDAEFRAFLLHRLKSFALSATALEHFLDEPQKFLEMDLLQLPQAKKSEFAYGNAVHDALKVWALKKQEGTSLTEADFMKSFSTYLADRETLTNAERARLGKIGEESLPRYYKERLATGNPFIHVVEYPISIRLNDIPLKGKLDRIDVAAPDSKHATVIDYKTGRPKSENEIRDGSYFRQLTFYALLLEHGMPFLEPDTFMLDFIGEGSESPVMRNFQISSQEKKDLQAVIQAVWTKILALDFTAL